MKKAKRQYRWILQYHPCYECGKKATWHYTPSGELDNAARNICDQCVPRGCECRVDHDTGLHESDAKGRELPCVEYDPYPYGYPRHFPERPSLRNRPAGQRKRWFESFGGLFDHRAWRGALRSWIKTPSIEWMPPMKRRWKNDMVASRLLKQAHAIRHRDDDEEATRVCNSPPSVAPG